MNIRGMNVEIERRGRPGATVQLTMKGHTLPQRLSIKAAIDLRDALTAELKAHADSRLLNAIRDA